MLMCCVLLCTCECACDSGHVTLPNDWKRPIDCKSFLATTSMCYMKESEDHHKACAIMQKVVPCTAVVCSTTRCLTLGKKIEQKSLMYEL